MVIRLHDGPGPKIDTRKRRREPPAPAPFPRIPPRFGASSRRTTRRSSAGTQAGRPTPSRPSSPRMPGSFPPTRRRSSGATRSSRSGGERSRPASGAYVLVSGPPGRRARSVYPGVRRRRERAVPVVPGSGQLRWWCGARRPTARGAASGTRRSAPCPPTSRRRSSNGGRWRRSPCWLRLGRAGSRRL